MTKSNRKLGKLILRDGLNLKLGELVTYEKLQQLERMVRPGANVLMFMDKPVGHYELEEYVFVMRDKIPKYVEMGYKIVAE